MKYNFLILTGLVLLISGCSTVKKNSTTKAFPVSDFPGEKEFTVVYNLPRTTVQFEIETTRMVTRRGPFFQYAEKYLGITEVPTVDSKSWHISGVSITTSQEADPEKYFVLTAQNNHSFAYLNLAKAGFILPVHQPQINTRTARFQAPQYEPEAPVFTDLSVNRVVAQETRPSLRLVQQDTAFVSIPILSRAMVRKSEEEKAKEAADFIIEIRKNRFNLISGDIDIFPDGMAMETILNEYRKLEENYLALFTGKTFKEVIKHVFEFIPAGNKDIESYVLFRFAENKGILPTNDISGRPIIIEITKENITAALDKLFAPANNTVNENRIYYRVPDVATIKLFDERSVIAETRVHISQFGKTLSIPANFNWE